MKQFTEQQIDRAREAFCESYGSKWQSEKFIESLCAAAPFLQLPWDEPTEEESFRAYKDEDHIMPRIKGFEQALQYFVRRRNAILIPYSVDPRRKAIVEVLKQYPDRAPEIADKILEALDEVK